MSSGLLPFCLDSCLTVKDSTKKAVDVHVDERAFSDGQTAIKWCHGVVVKHVDS